MVILSNCLTETVDEGCIKVANSLTKRIKKVCPDTTVISCGGISACSDLHLNMNRLLLSPSLAKILRKQKQPLLYIPFSSNTLASTLRLCVLSFLNPEPVTVLFTLKHPMNSLGRFFLKLSGAKVVTLSREANAFYENIIGSRASCLKAGVDIQQFAPVDSAQKSALREKYGIPADKRVVLHVGHMTRGRNVIRLCDLEADSHGVLVLSSVTRNQRDQQLQQKLMQAPNVTIIDTYIPCIQEIYQLADAYLFPVVEEGACIDLPLSVLEAAACGIPVVCTPYGALKEFRGQSGFRFLETLDEAELNEQIRTAAAENCNPRSAVLEYDWNLAINKLVNGA